MIYHWIYYGYSHNLEVELILVVGMNHHSYHCQVAQILGKTHHCSHHLANNAWALVVKINLHCSVYLVLKIGPQKLLSQLIHHLYLGLVVSTATIVVCLDQIVMEILLVGRYSPVQSSRSMAPWVWAIGYMEGPM